MAPRDGATKGNMQTIAKSSFIIQILKFEMEDGIVIRSARRRVELSFSGVRRRRRSVERREMKVKTAREESVIWSEIAPLEGQ